MQRLTIGLLLCMVVAGGNSAFAQPRLSGPISPIPGENSVAGGGLARTPANSNYCQVQRVSYNDGEVLDRNIQATPGSICTFSSAIPGAGISLTFPVKPKRGRVGISNQFQFAYVAPAAAGQDYFEFLQVWEDATGHKRKNLVRNFISIDPSFR